MNRGPDDELIAYAESLRRNQAIRAAAVQAAATILGEYAFMYTDPDVPEPNPKLIEMTSQIAMYINHGVWDE